MQILLAKCQSARAASHQAAFMGSCLTISHMCMSCLPSRWGSPCVLAVVLVLWGVDALLGDGYGIQRQNFVACFKGVKCQQGFTRGLWY